MARVFSVNDLYTKKRNLHQLPPGLNELIGKFERKGSWIVWGDSGQGKTSLVCQIAKALTKVDKVFYNSLEEGDSETLKQAFKRVKMEEVRRKIFPVQYEIEELKEKLRKQRAPKIVIMDSVQYTGLSVKDYRELKKEFSDVLWIWISHEEGKLPEGGLGKKIRYDSPVKIRVVGFKAFALSRYLGDTTPYVIYQKKADEYWAGGLLDEKKII